MSSDPPAFPKREGSAVGRHVPVTGWGSHPRVGELLAVQGR